MTHPHHTIDAPRAHTAHDQSEQAGSISADGISRRTFLAGLAALSCGLPIAAKALPKQQTRTKAVSSSTAKPYTAVFSASAVLHKNPQVTHAQIEGRPHLVIENSRPQKSCALNATAEQVWAAVDGRHTAAQIAEKLCRHYGEPAQGACFESILGFIAHMYAQGLVL